VLVWNYYTHEMRESEVEGIVRALKRSSSRLGSKRHVLTFESFKGKSRTYAIIDNTDRCKYMKSRNVCSSLCSFETMVRQ